MRVFSSLYSLYISLVCLVTWLCFLLFQVYQYLTSGSSEAGTLLEISDDVHIPLCSAYASTRGEPHFTNYTPGFTGTLDYILFSPENIKPVSYLELPEPEASDIQGGLPNYYHPSDHLPIGAEFEIIQ